MKDDRIQAGDILICKRRGNVKVVEVYEDGFIVDHKGCWTEHTYKDLGKIFILKDDIQTSENELSMNNIQCSECQNHKNGECFGEEKTCEFFIQKFELDKDEIANFPKLMLLHERRINCRR
jgi:hypothetical protein